MRLKNKKTGEIIEIVIVDHGAEWEMRNVDTNEGIQTYDSLAELNKEWEDYEEPKTHWMIDTSVLEPVREIAGMPYEIDKEIGNWFSAKEEAEKAVEKLKAWKRLKDKGFRLSGWTIDDGLRISICTNTDEDDIYDEDKRRIKPDLDLLFGGKE